MDKLKTLQSLMEDQLEQFTMRGNLSVQDVDILYKIVDIIKDIKTIHAMDSADQYGYSGLQNSYETSVTTPRGNTYGNGMTTNDMNYSQRMSRSGRYSGRMYRDDPKTKIINSLEDMMGEISSESDREVIIRCIEQLGN